MKLPRRNFLHLAAGAAALPSVSQIARGQTYPSRPVRWIVGFTPGGTTDILARLMAQWLSERLGQQFIIENRPGAGTNIALQAAVNSRPDGYTLVSVTSSNASNATLYESLPFNLQRDIIPVAVLSKGALVLEVNPSISIKSVAEFIAHAKTNPGKTSVASFGVGSTSHLAQELFKAMTGINVVHVPYRGDAPALPEVPTIGDFVPGYEVSLWNGVGAPRGTPKEIVERLNREINAGLADPKITARLVELGGVPMPLSPTEFEKLLADDTEKWAKVIRATNIKPE